MPQDPDEQAIVDPARKPPKAGAEAARKPLDPAARARIGRGLRLHYAELLTQPIPERLRTLIDDLAACSDTEAKR